MTWVVVIQYCVIKFFSDLQQVGDFLQVSFTNTTDHHDNWAIFESGAKHHDPITSWHEAV